ncbi:MAG TPA: hypothetical protein VD846_13165, partial [Allosphingosinicella sp.]|nr:hypothetical protein [Allosphingosinicella sp.]
MKALTRWLPGLPVLAALLALFPAAPARAQYDPPKQVTLSPTGVDFTKAHFHYKTTDFSIGPFKLERSYASGGPVWGSNHFGSRWTHNYSIFVYQKDTPSKLDNVFVVMGRDVVHFSRNGYTGGFSCWNPDCAGATLTTVGGALVYTDVHGNVYTFNPSVNALSGSNYPNQRIASVEYADGHTLSFSYTGSQLTQIASNYGYSLVFENSAAGYITKACVYNRAVAAAGPNCLTAPSSVTYQYNPNGDVLVNVIDLKGQNWGYNYSTATSAANMTCVRQVNSSACQMANTYSAFLGGVTVQTTTADTAVWTTTVNRPDPDDPQLPGEPPPYSDAGFGGPEGIWAIAELGGGLLNTYNENGRITHLAWDGIELAKLTHHEGNSVTYSRLGPIVLGETWTPKPGSGLSPVSWSMSLAVQQGASCATFPKTCHKPVWRKDYRDNRTDYTHDPGHGGVLTETGPPVNGVRPQKRYSYVERTAMTAGSVAAGRTIWLVERMAFCRAGNPNGSNTGCALGAADEVVTTYDYGPTTGPNNLQLRGTAVTADGTTLRTCYGYDPLGRKISETSPMGTAGLAACPAGPPTTALPYTTSTRYDPLSRVTGTIAPDPDGPGSPLPHPAVRNTYDNAGRLTKVENGSLSAWQPEGLAPAAWPGFTVEGRVETDYDAMGRKVREVAFGRDGARSGVTEFGYDLAGRLRCTAVRMNPDVWATPLPDKCVPGTAHAVHGPDRITRNHYTATGEIAKIEKGVGTPLLQVYASYAYSPNGKAVSVTDANGNRAQMTWDGLDRQKRWIFPSKTVPGDSDAADYEEYGYDAGANRTSLRKRDGSTLTYQYDALNRMSVKIVPERGGLAATHTRDVHYEYDNRGLQTKARFDSLAGEGVTNAYDGFGRLVSSSSDMGGTARTVGNLHDA